MLKDQADFVTIEKEKSAQFVTYDQYGAVGFNLTFSPSPLSIFFYKSLPIHSLESKIDASEKISIIVNKKGRAIFDLNGKFHDFSGIINVFVSLLMMSMGALSIRPTLFKSEEKFFKSKLILSRLLILNLFIFFLMLSMFLIILVLGIHFGKSDIASFAVYFLWSILFLDVCFFCGLGIDIISKNKYLTIVSTLLVWFIVIFLFPEIRFLNIKNGSITSPKSIDLMKLKTLMEKESEIREKILPLLKDKTKKKDEIMQYQKTLVMEYLMKGYKANIELELKLLTEVKAMIISYKRLAVATPSGAYLLLIESISSSGYDQYKDFVEHVLKVRDNFFLDYIDKRYNQKYEKVIPLTLETNLIKSRSYLPKELRTGLLITIVILLVLMFYICGYFMIKDNRQKNISKTLDITNTRKGKAYLMYDKDLTLSAGYKSFFKTRENTIIIEKVHYEIETSILRWLKYICKQESVDLRKALTYIENSGINMKALQKCEYKKRVQLFKKVYFALKLFIGGEILVIFNYFDTEAVELENYCKSLLKMQETVIIYISANPAKIKTDTATEITCFDICNENMTLR